jgi:hypothetical protein
MGFILTQTLFVDTCNQNVKQPFNVINSVLNAAIFILAPKCTHKLELSITCYGQLYLMAFSAISFTIKILSRATLRSDSQLFAVATASSVDSMQADDICVSADGAKFETTTCNINEKDLAEQSKALLDDRRASGRKHNSSNDMCTAVRQPGLFD